MEGTYRQNKPSDYSQDERIFAVDGHSLFDGRISLSNYTMGRVAHFILQTGKSKKDYIFEDTQMSLVWYAIDRPFIKSIWFATKEEGCDINPLVEQDWIDNISVISSVMNVLEANTKRI